MLEAQRCTMYSEIIDYICLLNDGDLFKIFSECGIPSTLAPHQPNISTLYHKEYTHWGRQTAADI